MLTDISSTTKKKEKVLKIRGGPIELAKCEFCGKLGPKAKFKRSKRFCSTSCAKRFNAGSSKRLAIILPDQDSKTGCYYYFVLNYNLLFDDDACFYLFI